MSRFHRYSHISPTHLYQKQVRRAWLSLWLMLPAILGLFIGIFYLPIDQIFSGWENTTFNGIPFIPQQQQEKSKAAKPLKAVAASVKAPVIELFPIVPTPQPMPEQHLLVDIPTEDVFEDETFEVEEDWTPEPTPTPAPAPVAKQSKPKQTSTRTAAPAPKKAATIVSTPASYRQAPPPPYPSTLRRRKLEGQVGVRIRISAEGTPEHVDISSPSPHREFNDTARSWILRRWLFTPATQNGTPIPSVIQTTVIFKL